MGDLMVIAVLLIVVGAALLFLVKSKKNGVKCIGCPAEGNFPHNHNKTSKAGDKCSCDCHTEVK